MKQNLASVTHTQVLTVDLATDKMNMNLLYVCTQFIKMVKEKWRELMCN